VVVSNCHANHFNLGSTEAPDPNDALLKLYDALALNNVNAPYVQLSMTCLTAQFAKPTNAGLTADESFFLQPTGGAIGVWGSSGLSVVHGHEQLQEGFFALLFDPKVQNPRLGDLLDAGYLQVMYYGASNEDILRTFLLLGDPLTRVRYRAGTGAFLPVVQNPRVR
jgi:hypothetical protein